MIAIYPASRFELGKVNATPGALRAAWEISFLSEPDSGVPLVELAVASKPVIFPMLDRHTRGDWGDLDAEDKATNDEATRDGSRILSAYLIGGFKFYVITNGTGDDGKRDATTVMLADEY